MEKGLEAQHSSYWRTMVRGRHKYPPYWSGRTGINTFLQWVTW